MLVPFNYLQFQFKFHQNYIKAWKKVIRSCEFTLGPHVEKFEKSFSRFIKAKHCISTNSGTDALVLALKSIGIKMVAIGVGRDTPNATIIATNLKYLGFERTLGVSRLNDIPKKVLNVLGGN